MLSTVVVILSKVKSRVPNCRIVSALMNVGVCARESVIGGREGGGSFFSFLGRFGRRAADESALEGGNSTGFSVSEVIASKSAYGKHQCQSRASTNTMQENIFIVRLPETPQKCGIHATSFIG